MAGHPGDTPAAPYGRFPTPQSDRIELTFAEVLAVVEEPTSSRPAVRAGLRCRC